MLTMDVQGPSTLREAEIVSVPAREHLALCRNSHGNHRPQWITVANSLGEQLWPWE
jgi:hypothetical protein